MNRTELRKRLMKELGISPVRWWQFWRRWPFRRHQKYSTIVGFDWADPKYQGAYIYRPMAQGTDRVKEHQA